MSRQQRQALLLSHLLFSMNLALLVVWVDAQAASSSAILRIFEYPIYRYIYPYLREIHPASNLRPGGYFDFLTLWFILTLLLFLVLRLSAGFASIGGAVVTVEEVAAIIVAITGFPLACLYRAVPHFSVMQSVWLSFEVLGIVVCAILYLARKWPAPVWLTIVLLAAHFTLWSVLLSVRSGLWFVFPMLGLGSAVAGALSLARSAERERGILAATPERL